MGGLLLAPALGVLTLNVALDMHLYLPKYFAFAAPAASIFVAHGIARLTVERQWTGWFSMAALLVVLWNSSWGAGADPKRGYPQGETEAWIGPVMSSEDVAVAVGAGYGRGEPAATIYDLASLVGGSEVDVLVITNGSSAEGPAELLSRYSNVWVVRAPYGDTEMEEQGLIDRMSGREDFERARDIGRATHFVRTAAGQ